MKNFPVFFRSLLLFVALIATPVSAHAGLSSWLKEYCDGKGIRACLHGVLLYKCANYSGFNPLSRREVNCEFAAGELVDLVDFDLAPLKDGEANQVVFKSKLGEILALPSTYDYLAWIPTHVENAMKDGSRFRLWEYTLRWTGYDEKKALEWIAVLFQDTQSNRIFTDYARIHGKRVSPKLAEAWDEAIEALSYAALTDPKDLDYRMFVRPYPQVDTENLNAGFYHFYFTAYLASELRRKGHSEAASFFVPFLLNSLYEFYEMPRKYLLSDPNPFDAKGRYAYKTTDLYSGYVASLWALGRYSEAQSFEKFCADLSAHPAKAMEKHYEWSPKKRGSR